MQIRHKDMPRFAAMSCTPITMLLMLLLLMQLPTAHALYFEEGYDHHYTYSSESDILGMHNITTVIKFRIRSAGSNLYMMMVDSFVQHSDHGYMVENALQWKLDHKFFFTMGNDGIVTMVHFHAEEIDEVLMLKKVLASTLSTKVQLGPEDSYVTEEEDHTGVLEHVYTAERHTDGIRITKGHKSLEDVHRSHNKTVNLDHKGTPLHVESLDNITLRHDPGRKQHKNFKGAAEIHDTMSGDFPRISSVSKSKMKLTAKSKHFENGNHTVHNLQQDTLRVREKVKNDKKPLSAVDSDIQQYLACIHNISNKYDRDRTQCVHDFRERVTSLEREDFIQLGKATLTKQCADDDATCVDERNLFLDIISQEGSSDAQLMMLNDVMLHPNVTEDDVRRCLFHCIALSSPVVELVEYVEGLCFAEDSKPGEAPALSKNRKRACLSLGAMAKSMGEKNSTVSDRIVDKIENWLGHHDEEKSKALVKPRQRRSIIQHDEKARKHIETKMVLLQSLGNAGQQRSLEHIKSYMAPNAGVMAWRRAAINSLRHFKCNESAHHLLTAVVEDKSDIVRQTARTVLKERQKTNSNPDKFTPEQENMILSKSYTYPVVARVRRENFGFEASWSASLEEGIRLLLRSPTIEWIKKIGTDDIGALLQLIVRNSLLLEFGLLDGLFEVDVYDLASAEAHVGMIDYQIDIVKAYICFNGHIKYDLNIFKDFGINKVSDFVKLYDKVVEKIVNPIRDAVASFRNIINAFEGKTIMDVIDILVRSVRHLPSIMVEVARRLESFVREVYGVAGNTVMNEIKAIVDEVRQYVEKVKTDVIYFYNEVVDIVTVGLPYIGKKIMQGYNLIVEALAVIFDNPVQGITGMTRAIHTVKTAVLMILQVKEKIEKVCQFAKGRATEWFETAKKVPSLLKRLTNAFQKLMETVFTRKRRDLVDTMVNTFSNGISEAKDGFDKVKEDLIAKLDYVEAPISELEDMAMPLLDGLFSILNVIDGLKWAYETVKEYIEIGKKLVQKVFGPKFHFLFPASRRKKEGDCKDGVYPSTAEDHYQTLGVDVSLGVGQAIKMPVNGIVHDKGGNKVVIKPNDDEFSAVEIVIENIVLTDNGNGTYDGKAVPAGEDIGKAGEAPRCKPNFIHVSTRKRHDGEDMEDSAHEYTDPSPFLDRLIPIPKWIQECLDYEFRYIGQTFDTGEASDSAEETREPTERDPDAKSTFDSILSAINPDKRKKRRDPNADELGGLLDQKLGPVDPTYRPDDPSLYDQTSFMDSLTDSLKDAAANFTDFFNVALFGEDGPKIPNILEIMDTANKSVSWVIDNLQNGTLIEGITEKVDDLCGKMTSVPTGNPLAFGIPYIQNLLDNMGIKMEISSGNMEELADTLMDVAENVCPMFFGAIAKNFGHVCIVQEDCLGIECNVPLPSGANIDYVTLGASYNDENLDVTVNGDSIGQINANGGDVQIDLDVEFFGLKLSLVVSADFSNGVLSLSLEAKLCADLFSDCLYTIELFHDITFEFIQDFIGSRRRRGIDGLEQCTGLVAMAIPSFISKLSDFNALEQDFTDTIDKARNTVIGRLLEHGLDGIGDVVAEFRDKFDFCISANIPIPPFDITFFNLRHLFMAGPVPLSLGFGAGGSIGMSVRVGLCVLSMTAKVTMIPWVGGKVWGDVSVDIGFARGGIRLIGYIVETRFPITIELVFSKYPLVLGSTMDLVLTPVRLQLKAFAELFLLVKTITVFEGTIWSYACPTITKNIFNVTTADEDPTPPEVLPDTLEQDGRRKRAGVKGCIVQQVLGRPYYDPAFTLEMHAKDERSEVTMSYAIGFSRGGTDVVDWTEMGGDTLLAPEKLPDGVPLYWSVKAVNSQGLEAVQQCSLNTYDSTLPDGRVEHAYAFSSHPSKLKASVVTFEDSPLVDIQYHAVGYSPGEFGNQFVAWQPFSLDQSALRTDVEGPLSYFTIPRQGKLVADVIQVSEARDAESCAQKCMDYGTNCVSFSYEDRAETCELHDNVEGANAYLRFSGTYTNYERLDRGFTTLLEYQDLELSHGTMYYVNAKITNTMDYEAFLIGEGTMVDFTPPEPGVISNAVQDVLRVDGCYAAITQVCIEVTWKENHRVIIDGEGSETVFNGPEAVIDRLYTLTNHYVTANWKGFHDDESGIGGYTWAVGTTVCGDDIIPFEDPNAHLTSSKFWTDSAFHKGIHLPDGKYYVTVQALNGAELGGSLVTTVCHSTPFAVDTTAPLFEGVTDIIFDEDFDLIAIYYKAKDELSQIADVEFGLGKTKYDSQLRPYGLHPTMDRDDPFLAVEELGLEEGIPAWLRVRVTNHVGLFTAGAGDEAVIIDRSGPLAGAVMDGDRLRRDLIYQSDNSSICAQWINFHDPESGIGRYIWGVGTEPKLDDVVPFHNLTHYDKSGCAEATLEHNRTYYSTVFAFNTALNSKDANASSDGVLVDTTPPIPAAVYDGPAGEDDLRFTSETVSKHANWKEHSDPESGVVEYQVSVYINGEHKKTFDVDMATEFEDRTISMEHKDRVRFTVHGINGAELEATSDSNGFVVDHTPPVMTAISDSPGGAEYQGDSSSLQLSWDFYDDESYIEEYRWFIYKLKHGVKTRFWPNGELYNETLPTSPTDGQIALTLGSLAMENGAKYSLHVTALNGANLATSHEAPGVTIDATPPNRPTIRVGLPKEDEYLDELGRAVHNDQHAIHLSWAGRDSESGIVNYKVAIGTDGFPESVRPYSDFGTTTSAYIPGLEFDTSSDTGITYLASVIAVNGAGLQSAAGTTREIFIQKANVPGVVFDGRNLFQDKMYTTDRTSIAASFFGFDSESCNIMSYEWAIGTEEYGTQIQPYTNYGLVMLNATYGQAQVHMDLTEDTTYYITVRAVTGCRDEYILSSSDGITVDTTSPEVAYTELSSSDTTTVVVHGVLFQDAIDTLALTSDVNDTHSIASTSWALGSLLRYSDRHPYTTNLDSMTSVFSQEPGEATFLTTDTVDMAGNRHISSSMAVIADNTSPRIINLECTDVLSYLNSMLTCSWKTLVEYESLVDKVTVKITTNDGEILLNNYEVPVGVRNVKKDLYNELKTLRSVTSIITTFVISNVVGLDNTYGRETLVDTSEPEADSLEVVTSPSLTPAESHLECQEPRGFVELRVRGAADAESGIDTDRFEASLGLRPYGTDFVNYAHVTQREDETFFLDGFILDVGTVFYATLRVYNRAGLYVDVTSESVVVSQAPYLTVMDGDGDEDVDYQSFTNLLKGQWEYSDACPIREAEWTAEDLSGVVLFDYMAIPSVSKKFYNDDVLLENGKKYIVTVRTIDSLDRTKTARSDGVSIRLQPPMLGYVRDGLLPEDINYQYSNTELSANWNGFGDDSQDPTQSITSCAVAIGNDRRYETTRYNVHYFVDVALNTSHTFTHLNLTEKLVRYYITVRCYSKAGGIAEVTSNGIRVGYHDEIGPGDVTLNSYQSQNNSIAVSWDEFASDIDILLYMVGIGSRVPNLTDDTLTCDHFLANGSAYDVKNLTSVGLNRYVNVKDIQLEHGQEYFVTVVAEDEAGMCIAATSKPCLVDITPPVIDNILINGMESDVISFAISDTELEVELDNAADHESDILETTVSLFECNSCHPDLETAGCYIIAENKLHSGVFTSMFYDIQLYADKAYAVRVDIQNRAQLHTVVTSATILVDSTPVLSGEVKVTTDWHINKDYQYSTTEIVGWFAIVSTYEGHECRNQIQFFPTNTTVAWYRFSNSFSNKFKVVNDTGAYLGIGYESASENAKLHKTGMRSKTQDLKIGNYTFDIRPASGLNIITTAAVMSNTVAVPFVISDKKIEEVFDASRFDNVAGLQASNDSDTSNTTTTTTAPVTGRFVPTYEEPKETTVLNVNEFGFGVHFLGYKIENNTHYWHLFWARNKLISVDKWFRHDASKETHAYSINVRQAASSSDASVDLTLYVDDEEIGTIVGFLFESDMKIGFVTWNEDNYRPQSDDVFHPFYSEAIISRVAIPDKVDTPCMHGRGFFDGESGIKEIHLGVSDSTDEVGNILPLKKFESFCFPCVEPCDDICQQPCNDTRLSAGFNLIPIEVTGLELEPTEATDLCLNVSLEAECSSLAYYVNAKIVNFAGIATTVHSNAIQVDITRPEFEYVRCLDPEYDEDAPTRYLGSDRTVGAYWECDDDVSLVDYYNVTIVSANSSRVILESTSVGLTTKAVFDLGRGTFQNEEHYIFQVTATNTAGMNVTSSCDLQVFLFPPNVTEVSVDAVCDDCVAGGGEDATYWTTAQNDAGLTWSRGRDDTEFMELTISTGNGKEDVFPATKVGGNTPGSAAIRQGKLELDNDPTNTTLHDFLDRTNMNVTQIEALDAYPEEDKSFFLIEPGRCLFLQLVARGYSHLSSKVSAKSLCNKRVDDVNVAATDSDETGRVVITKAKRSVKWENRIVNNVEVVIDTMILNGSLSCGTLDAADKTKSYGSAATSEYQAYIADPSLTSNQTTRILRGRINKFCDLAFYISPATSANVTDLKFNVTLPSDCDKDTDFQPALIYWDTSNAVWKHVDEGCYNDTTAIVDEDTSTYMTEICIPAEDSSRRRRETTTLNIAEPVQYELAQIYRSFPNSGPTIVSEVLQTQEDTVQELQVEAEDPDNDTLTFELLEQPTNAVCELDNATGILNCTLDENFFGLNYLKVKVTETGLPPLEQAISTEKTITLNVTSSPDPTDRYFVDRFGTIHSDVKPFFYHTIVLEANSTESVHAGEIVLADLDAGEEYNETTEYDALGTSTFTLAKTSLDQTVAATFTNYTTVQAYSVSFSFSSQLNGNMTLRFIAQTANGDYTPSVIIDVFILAHPCVNGECNHPSLGTDACSNTDRAISFDAYECVCSPGFTGTWCETELNECEPNPCSSLFDCEDKENSYECVVNIPKLMGVLTGSLAGVGGIAFLVFKLRQMISRKKMRNSRVSLANNDDQPSETDADSQPLTPEPRPDTSPGIDNAALKPDEGVDLSALAFFTAAAGSKMPPHHGNMPGTDKPSFVPGSNKPFNAGNSRPFASTPAFNLGQGKPKWPPVPTETPCPMPSGPGITEVGEFDPSEGRQTPQRCPSASSQRTVSTIEGDQIHLTEGHRMSDIDV